MVKQTTERLSDVADSQSAADSQPTPPHANAGLTAAQAQVQAEIARKLSELQQLQAEQQKLQMAQAGVKVRAPHPYDKHNKSSGRKCEWCGTNITSDWRHCNWISTPALCG